MHFATLNFVTVYLLKTMTAQSNITHKTHTTEIHFISTFCLL